MSDISMSIQVLSPPDVCEMLGVSNATLVKWRQEGRGPRYSRIGHRTVRYLYSDVLAWIEETAR